MSKKTEVITFRTEDWIKNEILKYAEANRWTPAQTVEQIIKIFIANPRPGHIIIPKNKLTQIVNEMNEEYGEGVEIQIDIRPTEDETDIEKYISFATLESGGLGLCMDYDDITEMTEEEISNIP